jgi:hypothetical protein
MNKSWLIAGTTIATGALIQSHFPPEACEREAEAVYYACQIGAPEALHTHVEGPPLGGTQGGITTASVTSATATASVSDTWDLRFG